MGRTKSAERQMFLWDVMSTALEGGVNSWSAADEIVREVDPGEDRPLSDPRAMFHYSEYVLFCSEGGPEPSECGLSTKENPIDVCPGHRVDPDVIARGIGLASLSAVKGDQQGIGWHYSQRRHVIEGNRENDAGDIDAFDANCIVQLGVFGSVIYG